MELNLDFILNYFTEEKISNYIMMLIAIFAILLACVFLFIIKYSFFKGMTLALLIIGLIQLITGATIFFQLPKQLANVERIITHEAQKIKTEEIQRIEIILDKITVYKWVEIFSFVIALFIYFIFYKSTQTFWKGLALGLLIQLGLFFTISSFSKQRNENYLQNLKIYKVEVIK